MTELIGMQSGTQFISGLISRGFQLFRRRHTAAKLGLSFRRSATFVVPSSISLYGKEFILSVPSELGSKAAFIDLFLDDCYGCRKLSRSRAPIRTIVDIGANVGLFSLMAKIEFPEATVHAYEPNQRIEDYLNHQSRQGGFSYFIEAVGRNRGYVALHTQLESVYTRTTEVQNGSLLQVSFAEVVDRIGGKVDFLKIDCEGAEWGLLDDQETWKKIQYVALEYHLWDNHTLSEMKSRLAALGFAITKHVPLGDVGLMLANRRQSQPVTQ